MFSHAATDQGLQTSYGKLPLAFEENRGQAPAGVRYLCRTRGGVVFLRPGSVALESGESKRITMRFVGATSSVPAGENMLPGVTSYLVGDKDDWVRGISNYASVRYASVYPGIDAVFHGDLKHLEYDFVLNPGADPDQIRIAFDGVDHLLIDAQGNLELRASHGTMTQRKPRIWQTEPHGRREVAGRYVLSGAAEARFVVDQYDRRSSLVIDPVIEYSTYFGSTREDRALGVTTDQAGATYVAGSTATGGVSWGFVSKVNPGGTAVLYTVYFGSGACNAEAHGIAVDSANDAIVTGYYTQKDASGACNVKQALGAKINPAGDAFVYQLAWGGSQDYGNAVAVDGSGNAYFTGSTSGGFPTTPGVIFPSGRIGNDAFITKLGPTGTLLYSTYLGGGLIDEGLAITVDTSGNAYVAGSTNSLDFPTTANAVRATLPNTNLSGFITKVNNTATQISYSTFLGGSSGEKIYGIALDGQGKIHVAGTTISSDFPTTANAWDRTCGADGACSPYYDGAWHNAEDAFYSRVDPLKAGISGLTYSSFLGGANRDFGEAIAIDKNGCAWITGVTGSAADFPKAQATQGTIGGNYDAFITQIDPAQSGAASLLFSSFLGGSLYDEGTGIRIDSLGNIYVVGYTGSTNFPVVGALQPQTAGGNDGFVVKISAPAGLASVGLNPATVTGGANSTGTLTLTAPAPAGGAVVTLTTSNSNAATVPASVTVAAGATSATFTVTTKTVTAGLVVNITASWNGVSKTAGLVVNPLLASITLNPSVLTGGAGSTGTVTLNSAAPAGGAVVTLVSSNTNAAAVPASAAVAAGAKSANFAITTKAVTTVTAVNITATYAGASTIVTLVVNPPLASITLNPASVTGNAGSTGTVTLAAAASAGGAVVTLTSSNINVATVPASVTVTAGATTGTFAIATKPVATQTAVTITATYSGAVKTTTLVVNPAGALAALALNPPAVAGGAGSTGTVTLNIAAPAGGATVTLVSSNTNAATVPASVTLAAGATTGTFTVTTKAVTTATAVTITATYSGANKAATLTVNPPTGLAALTLNPATVTGGAGSTGTMTLAAAAPAGGVVVALTSSNTNAATVPASVTVAAGATTATFAITSKTVTTATVVTITATYNGAAKAATLTVNPPGALAGLAMNPATMIFGSSSTGTVTLTSAAPAGGATVALSSSDWVDFYLPASVTVPAGATFAQFTVTTAIGKSTTTITASYNGVNKTATLTSVYPTATALTCTPNPVIAGNTTICTVTLNGIMPAATTVWILSDQPFFAPASGTVTVPAGAASTAFSITTTLVPDQIVAHISASALATATVIAPLTINLTNRGRKWVLNNVVFKDGGNASGYFTYDAATGKYLDANILVTPGPDPLNPMGQPPENLYYYPWPNGSLPAFVDDWSTASVLSMQNPIGSDTTPPEWTLLQLNFAQPLTNAGGTINLVTNPNVAYTTHCTVNTPPLCTPPPGNISQELFALPPLPGYTAGSYYFRVIVSGTVTAQ
jgi:hypothetical protein